MISQPNNLDTSIDLGKVLYDDGETEILNMDKEIWEALESQQDFSKQEADPPASAEEHVKSKGEKGIKSRVAHVEEEQDDEMQPTLGNSVMPTVIVFEYDGEWKSNNDRYLNGVQGQVIMGLVGTERLRISYVPDVRHWHMRPIYIENDNDLKAYLYFGCPKDRPVLHVEVEPSIISEEVGMESRALDIVVGSAELGDAILTETVGGGNVTDYCYDEYFDRKYCLSWQQEMCFLSSKQNHLIEVHSQQR
ncbi:hypothetical protein F511_36080 [Dorcoceras hygrometricum]|uniref:Uncharacterized protein n=1 Tax=Dorcoceras hygrometricum TaxID=472368 RepID=A0A2Z7D728_9LAMI|nr:hypothetical protein F511_36080 [Dorcoceras hygrometricum]